ncbi:hypothetical protein DENSPDRAFT_776207 [Dentipellis sp. KUC8613]|nr:hypothetical protein DENSPDRAFT_776207 [Dentipellis sp. KUC8613]
MGSATSKAARTLPKTAAAKPPPSWAGARTPALEDLPTRHTQRPLASETKDDNIMKDAQDPQLHANLARLGPVRVDHHMQSVRTSAQIRRRFESRAQSEADAASSHAPRNRLLAASLSDLLDQRKYATSRKELEKFAEQYGIEVQKLESVARYVSTPSVDEKTAIRMVEDNGEESITMVVSLRLSCLV